MTGAEKLLRAAFPTRKSQLRYHAEIERVTGCKVVRVMGRWEIVAPKKAGVR